MIFEPRACDYPATDIESALLRTAVGDYAAEAAVLLLVNHGHWLPRLQAADLIAVALDDDPTAPPTGEIPAIGWATITWSDIDPALADQRILGAGPQQVILAVAASLADGRPLDLGQTAGSLDRHDLHLLLAAIAHAGGSHDHAEGQVDGCAGSASPGHRAGSLVPWPARD